VLSPELGCFKRTLQILIVFWKRRIAYPLSGGLQRSSDAIE